MKYEIYDDAKYEGNGTVTKQLQDHIANIISKPTTKEKIDELFAEKWTQRYEESFFDKVEKLPEDRIVPVVLTQTAPDPAYHEVVNNVLGGPFYPYPTGTLTIDPAKLNTTTVVMPKKDGNPKTAVGSKKFSPSVMSAAVTAEIAVGMLEGARKYGRHNWRDEGARASTYWDAALRHLFKWYEGEDIDPDSGLPHIVKAMASLYVLRDAMIHGNWVDDRPPALPTGWYEDLDRVAAEIIERYPDAREPHLNKKDGATT